MLYVYCERGHDVQAIKMHVEILPPRTISSSGPYMQLHHRRYAETVRRSTHSSAFRSYLRYADLLVVPEIKLPESCVDLRQRQSPGEVVLLRS